MSKAKRIFIVGHMGAGKALLGKALADKLGWKFIDANLGLERTIGCALNDIIGNEGVKVFQQTLSEIMKDSIGKENIVVSTDDSIVDTEKNRQSLSSEYAIYLKVNTSEQIKRMSNGPAPLLSVVELKAFLDKLHVERDRLFEEVATLVVDSKSVDDDVQLILKKLEG